MKLRSGPEVHPLLGSGATLLSKVLFLPQWKQVTSPFPNAILLGHPAGMTLPSHLTYPASFIGLLPWEYRSRINQRRFPKLTAPLDGSSLDSTYFLTMVHGYQFFHSTKILEPLLCAIAILDAHQMHEIQGQTFSTLFQREEVNIFWLLFYFVWYFCEHWLF